jgi:hypothetical protein
MSRDVLEAVAAALEVLEPLDDEGRERALRWLGESLGVQPTSDASHPAPNPLPPRTTTPAPGSPAPPADAKAFLLQKDPADKGQQLAVLAYFKTHFEGTDTFTTQDLVDLNVVAGGPRIANPSRDMDNATRKAGLFTTVSGRSKKLSALGELVVDALPDRAAAREVLKQRRPKKRVAKRAPTKTTKAAKKR